MLDIVIRKANTRKFKEPVDIGISGGKITEIGEIKESGNFEIDASSKLVTESFVNTHLHLCKVYTLMMMSEEAL
ncbi:MAG: amidohydrolase family protein, partial [Caldisericaceae bacterium]